MTELHRKGPAGDASRPKSRWLPGMADWLHLAAAPTFAMMALLTTIGSTDATTCMGMAGPSPLGGMSLMYLLMSAFHAIPWLRLASRP
jgi:hypothetical protein